MRTIKFRGRHLCGQWYYGNLIVRETDSPVPETPLAYKCFYIGDVEDGSEKEVEEETIGQFTGLLDKSGQEIYEDDIVRDSEGRISYVKWLIQRCGFVLVYERFDKDIIGSYGKIEHLEVIGNIHDNKELLKEK